MGYVYKLTNTKNGKIKVGICVGKYNLTKLFWLLTDVKRPAVSDKIKNDLLTFGRESFTIEKLIESNDIATLNKTLDDNFTYDYSHRKCYAGACTRLTVPKSSITRKRMSDAKKGVIPPRFIVDKRRIGTLNKINKVSIPNVKE